MPSAVIVRVELPDGLEALRRRCVANAASGVPAHVTMLFPFVEASGLTSAIEGAVAAVAALHPPIGYRITGPHRWPDAVYAAVEPVEPFVRLQGALAAAFPRYPIYGAPAGFVFIPHITIGDGVEVNEPGTMGDRAWSALPVDAVASRIEVIASDGGRWQRVWTFPLGGRREPVAR
jgi:2'-5' RNA ligase